MKTRVIPIITGIILAVCIAWICNGMPVSAETNGEIEDLEPVIYEKLKFKKNTDYLHDKKKLEMKNTIQVKQFDIHFDGTKQLPKRDDTSFLFQTTARGEKSTTAAKASELQLFTKSDEGEEEQSRIVFKEEVKSNNAVRTMILIGIIGVGLVFLFTIYLPKVINVSNANARNFSGESFK